MSGYLSVECHLPSLRKGPHPLSLQPTPTDLIGVEGAHCLQPESAQQREDRVARQAELIQQFCPDDTIREPLLRFFEEEESLCSLAEIWDWDRRTVKKQIPRILEQIRQHWLLYLSGKAIVGAMLHGMTILCPWTIDPIWCCHPHATAAEGSFDGLDPLKVKDFIEVHQSLLFGGPPNRHLLVSFDEETGRTHCAILRHRLTKEIEFGIFPTD